MMDRDSGDRKTIGKMYVIVSHLPGDSRRQAAGTLCVRLIVSALVSPRSCAGHSGADEVQGRAHLLHRHSRCVGMLLHLVISHDITHT